MSKRLNFRCKRKSSKRGFPQCHRNRVMITDLARRNHKGNPYLPQRFQANSRKLTHKQTVFAVNARLVKLLFSSDQKSSLTPGRFDLRVSALQFVG